MKNIYFILLWLKSVRECVSDYSKYTDEQLILMFQKGDIKAYNQIESRYRDKLLNFINGYMRNYEASQDLRNDTLVKVYTHGHTYKEISKFSSWVYTIAGNLAKTELRKLKRRKTYSFSQLSSADREFTLDRSDYQNNDEASDGRHEMYKEILKYIELLDEDSRIIITLRDIQELSYDEISKIAGLPIGTVKSRINRARLKILEMLKKNKK